MHVIQFATKIPCTCKAILLSNPCITFKCFVVGPLPEISDAHYVFLTRHCKTSVNFPRTRPLKCMEQTAFLFNLNQERTEMKNSFKITVKHIISYALFMK